jgi:ribonuclease P protein component
MLAGPRDAPDSLSEASAVAIAGFAIAGFSFPASRRLRGASVFERAFRTGQRRTGRFFVVYRITRGGQHPCLGMVISKRIAGDGVYRNRLKRLVRETFRTLPEQIQPFDFVVRLKARPDRELLHEASHELTKLFLGAP